MFCPPTYHPVTTSIDKAREVFQQQQEEDCRIVAHPESITFAESRKLVGEAFGGLTAETGEPLTLKILEPVGLNADEDTIDRQDLTGFCLGMFEFGMLEKGGMIVGIREEGKLKAMVVFREHDPGQEANQFSFIRAIKGFLTNVKAFMTIKDDSLGLPKILENKEAARIFQESSTRFMPFESILHDWHQTYGPKEPHWYIGIVACDPESHGKGYGTEIMNLINRAADQCGMACYLECAESRRGYYERFGYEETKMCTARLGEGTKDDVQFQELLMTRPSQGS